MIYKSPRWRYAVLSFTAVLLLTFFAGWYADHRGRFPHLWIEQADMAYHAVRMQEDILSEDTAPAKPSNVPSVQIHKSGTYDGYTLYTSRRESAAYLVDMDGRVVHQWEKLFSHAWSTHPRIDHPLPDSNIHWFYAYLYPNGDLLADYEARGDAPHGYGLVKLDKDSNILWRYEGSVNHTFFVDEKGMIYGLTNQFVKSEDLPALHFPEPKLVGDWMVVLTPDGKEMKKLFLPKLMLDSPYRDWLIHRRKVSSIDKREHGDIMHPNSIVVLSSAMAPAFPMFKAGQVLISFRLLDAVVVVDTEKEKIVWAARGPWRRQHDAEFAKDGTIVMFDNLGAGSHHSRILKYDPKTKISSTLFIGTNRAPFFTKYRGMQQLLPNGNMLLNEAARATIWELTPDKKVVWKFVDPVLVGGQRLPITSATRFGMDDLPFLKSKPQIQNVNFTSKVPQNAIKRAQQ